MSQLDFFDPFGMQDPEFVFQSEPAETAPQDRTIYIEVDECPFHLKGRKFKDLWLVINKDREGKVGYEFFKNITSWKPLTS